MLDRLEEPLDLVLQHAAEMEAKDLPPALEKIRDGFQIQEVKLARAQAQAANPTRAQLAQARKWEAQPPLRQAMVLVRTPAQRRKMAWARTPALTPILVQAGGMTLSQSLVVNLALTRALVRNLPRNQGA